MRDDFAASLKHTLADKVAWKCSLPGCYETTNSAGIKMMPMY